MDIKKVLNLVNQGESSTLEFKKSLSDLEKIGKTISSFANTEGGTVLIGISDDRQLLGVDLTDSVLKKIASFHNQFEPWANLEIKYISIPSTKKSIILIHCKKMPLCKPLFYKSRAFFRNQSTIQPMDPEILTNRLLSSDTISKKWESQPTNFSLDDLDHEEIFRTVKLGQQIGRIPQKNWGNDIEDILTSLELYSNKTLCNAAMILFGKNLPDEYSHSYIRMGRFLDAGMNKTLDSQQKRGNAFQILTAAEEFISKNLPVLSRFQSDKFERIDEPVLPLLAVREAIINAIVHRNYAKGFGDISIFIFNTHLEIHNIGTLMGGLRIEDLNERHPSLRRNEKIAEVFFIRKLIEKWGSGISRIKDLCTKSNIPPVHFSQSCGGFNVNFKFKQAIGPTKFIDQSHINLNLSENQLVILNLLKKQGKQSLKNLTQSLENRLTERSIRYALYQLKEKDIVKTEGYGRGAKWCISETTPIP